MPTCCIHGCVSKPDVTLFEFPTSRVLRKRWLDAMPQPAPCNTPSVLDEARVCSRHFADGDYEEVRGRVRLKGKVVPTIFGDQAAKPKLINDPLGSMDSTENEDSQDNAQTDKQTTHNDHYNGNVDNHNENDSDNQKVDNETVENAQGKMELQCSTDITGYGHKDNVDNNNKADDNEEVTNDNEIIANGNEVAKDNENVASDNEKVASDNEKIASDNEKIASDNEKVASDNEKVASDNEKVVSDNEKVAKDNKNVASDNGKVTSDSEKVANDSENVTNDSEHAGKTVVNPLKRKVKKKIVPMRKVPFKRMSLSDDSEDSVNSDAPPPPPPLVLEDLEDLEEHLPNYQIANMKTERQVAAMSDSRLHPPEQEEEEEMMSTPHVPVYIELSVGQEGGAKGEHQNDCLMVMESVQCDVDVALLLAARDVDDDDCTEHVDLDDDDDDDDVTFMREDKAPSPETEPAKSKSSANPISLLTSSDEDDVILQEPHIDCLSVSDETDEDDVPLQKLIKRNKIPKQKKKSKSLKNILVHQADYFCVHCNHVSLTRSDYNLHRKSHKPGKESITKVYQICKECGFTTSSKSQLHRHQKKHLNEKRFKCPLCTYRSKYNMSLLYHLKTHDFDPNMYNCGACGLELDSKKKLLEHQKCCNELSDEFVCKMCNYVCQDKRVLKLHRNTVHKQTINVK